jgi:hypothetical protein
VDYLCDAIDSGFEYDYAKLELNTDISAAVNIAHDKALRSLAQTLSESENQSDSIQSAVATLHAPLKLIKQFAAERPLILVCDLHGHSRRKNVFMYGNSDIKNPEASRIFPFLLSKLA